MVPSITTILHRFTGEWATLLQADAILALCSEMGYTAWRDRVLTPVTTMQLFLLQILYGNTACRHLPHLSGLRFTAAAYCQARAKLPLRFFDLLLERFGSAVQRSAVDDGRWQGHRTFLVDGSGCSMPDTPALQAAFGQSTEQRPGCGFPVARLLGLFHAGTGVLLKLLVAPLLTHDLAQVQAVHPSLQEGDVLVADRGLCSYAHLALLVQAGVHAVLRVGARQIVDFTPGRPFVRPSVRRTPAVKGIPRSRWLKALGVHDQLVTWLKPKTSPSWLTREMLAALPETLELREVRYGISTPGFRSREITLVTTLLDAEVYRVAELAALYRQRWQVETALAQLKTTMRMEVLHCKTVPGVLKELTVFAIVYNLVRMVMCQSARLQQIGVERISFVDALRWLSAPSSGMPLVALIVVPVRPHRVEPRVKKRRPKSFPFMITPRQELRQRLVQPELRG
ncbi:MAG TPA: IS4 family transposase [Candidatus Tectomicrobia bacterium]|nr:IS4 family transposase [Candidatus Tectomicrobia bacterium]